MEKYTLTKELQEDLFKIRAKVEVEKNPAFFTQNDRAVMAAAYNELTNKKPCWNCSGFMSKIRLSLTNYFKWYDHNEMEKVQIDDRELKAVNSHSTEEGSIDYHVHFDKEEIEQVKEKFNKMVNAGLDEECMKDALEDFEAPTLIKAEDTFVNFSSDDVTHLLNLNELTLSELRELYPNIKSNSKSKFIQKIQENEQ